MRVLVVEDFDLLRDSVCQALREAGHAVDAAADGQEALHLALGADYDVIVLDLMLPRLDGIAVLRRLRASGSNSAVLILTARDRLADRVAGLDAGADDYLVKPFDLPELLARVRALVRRQYHARDPILRVADLEIDTAARSARRGGSRIALTPREYAVLEYLALRRGKLVTRSDLWEHVYEYTSDATSNVVDVFIAHLRRKIDTAGRVRLIHTRRGHGYVFDEAAPHQEHT